MLMGATFDLFRDGDTVEIVDKVLGEKRTLSLEEFEDYLEDVFEFLSK